MTLYQIQRQFDKLKSYNYKALKAHLVLDLVLDPILDLDIVLFLVFKNKTLILIKLCFHSLICCSSKKGEFLDHDIILLQGHPALHYQLLLVGTV